MIIREAVAGRRESGVRLSQISSGLSALIYIPAKTFTSSLHIGSKFDFAAGNQWLA